MIIDGFAKIDPGILLQNSASSMIISALDGFLIQSLIGVETLSGDEFVTHLDIKI